MLTKLTIRNFKRFEDAAIELGSPVVFVGPNDSGKTTALQALALWNLGVKRWHAKRGGQRAAGRSPGVTFNRRDAVAIPHPRAALLWRGLRTRDVRRVEGRQATANVRIELRVDGVSEDRAWSCGLEFDYANEESFYCRPLPLGDARHPPRMPVPDEAAAVDIAYLPPLSGLAATETRLDPGAVDVRIGEGRTAEVLRNLCFRIARDRPRRWAALVGQIEQLFGARLDAPRYVEERGEITMGYQEHGASLDLSSSGRGLQQTLLILAYLYARPGAVLLLDEPDAHLEVLRQRELYALISRLADAHGSQVIAASHSEVLLNEAADRDLVIAFAGRPHRLGSRQGPVRKALAEVGFDQYCQAAQTGWVLYLEGAADLAILQALAQRLRHGAAIRALARPFVRYVGHGPDTAARHFHGLREAFGALQGVALFNRLDSDPAASPPLEFLAWRRRGIANYLCTRQALEAYAAASAAMPDPLPLFTSAAAGRRLAAMRAAIEGVSQALGVLDKPSPWDPDLEAGDAFLEPLFRDYFGRIELPNLMAKRNYHELVAHLPDGDIAPEVGEKLDAIAAVAERVEPVA